MFGSRTLCCVCIGLFLASSSSSCSYAQSDVPKAVLVYVADVETLLSSKSVKLLGGDEFLNMLGIDNEDLKTVRSVAKLSVHVAAPTGSLDPESISKTNFLVVLEMKDEKSAVDLEEQLEGGFIESELNGKKVWKADGPGAPPMLAHRQGKVILFGSEDYLFANPKSIIGKDIRPLLDELKASPLKMVASFDGAREFLTELSKLANENADFMSRQYISLLDQIATLEVAWDFDGETIFFTRLKGHNEDENKKIKLKMDAAVGLFKGFAEIGLAELERESPDVAKFAVAVMEKISVEGKPDSTIIRLKRPEDYENLLRKSLKATKASAENVQDLNKMRQVALAKHNYYETQKIFPFAEVKTQNVSWRVNVLPYLEEANLYNEFDLTQKWSAGVNSKLISEKPETFTLSNGASISVVQPEKPPKTFAEIRDGTSNTIVFIENRKAAMIPWTKPHRLTVKEVIKMVSDLKDGDSLIVAFYDGSVRRISNQSSAETIRKLCDPDDGTVIEPEEIK